MGGKIGQDSAEFYFEFGEGDDVRVIVDRKGTEGRHQVSDAGEFKCAHRGMERCHLAVRMKVNFFAEFNNHDGVSVGQKSS